MAKKGRNNTQAAYKTELRFEKNRKLKLERHLKKYPNDEKAKAALKKRVEYRRRAPYNNIWSPMKKLYAEELASLGINGNIALKLGERTLQK